MEWLMNWWWATVLGPVVLGGAIAYALVTRRRLSRFERERQSAGVKRVYAEAGAPDARGDQSASRSAAEERTTPVRPEVGSRKLVERTDSDPSDEFSQDAATNRKPPLGMGLTERVSVERSETDKSDLKPVPHSPEDGARGQSEDRHAGGSNDGMVSANPRVLSGREDGDATFPFKEDHRK